MEAALLLEEGYQNDFDMMWYVYVDEATRIERLKEGRDIPKKSAVKLWQNSFQKKYFGRNVPQ